MLASLPQELVDLVVDNLMHDRQALAKLLLVSHSFSSRARWHIFSDISFLNAEKFNDFYPLVRQCVLFSPSTLVRCVQVDQLSLSAATSSSVHDVLRTFRNLRVLELKNVIAENLSNSVLETLHALRRVHTLRLVHVRFLGNNTLSCLTRAFPRLRTLELRSVHMPDSTLRSDSHGGLELLETLILSSSAASTFTAITRFDLSNLRRLEVAGVQAAWNLPILLAHVGDHLEHLEIVQPGFGKSNHPVQLAVTMPKVAHIKLLTSNASWLYARDMDWLTAVLSQSCDDRYRQVHVVYRLEMVDHPFPPAHDWGALDLICSRLKYTCVLVTLAIGRPEAPGRIHTIDLDVEKEILIQMPALNASGRLRVERNL